MEIKVGNFVKTYDLCTGKIYISQIQHIYNKDKDIVCWSGTDEFRYEGEKPLKIKPYTAIWVKSDSRWVFKLPKNGYACFSTMVLDACEDYAVPYRLGVSNEKVEYLLP